MANEGILITAGVSWLGALAFLLVAAEARPRPGVTDRRQDIFAWYLIAALFMGLVGLRLVFGYAGWAGLDEGAFYLVAAPAFLSTTPLMHLAVQLMTQNGRTAAWTAAGAAVLGLVGLVPFYITGLAGPEIGYWATEWQFKSRFAGRVLLLGVLPMALAASMGIVVKAQDLEGVERLRYRITGASIGTFYVFLVVDGLNLLGPEGLLFVRLAMVVTAVAVYWAYRQSRGATSEV